MTVAPASQDPSPRDIEHLGEQIAELSAHIDAATYRLLVLIADFDDRCGWDCGFKSCAHWLNWRTGINLGAAREKVRVARALTGLPRMSGAMELGELSYSKVRALTRVATSDNEEELLVFARAGTAAHVETLVRLWRRADRCEEIEADERRRTSRSLTLHPDEDGMYRMQGLLEPEVGAVLSRALEAAVDALYCQGPSVDDTTPSQRLADAAGLIAEAALEHGLKSEEVGSRAGRHQVVVHVDAEALEEGSELGQAALEDGIRVSAEIAPGQAWRRGKSWSRRQKPLL